MQFLNRLERRLTLLTHKTMKREKDMQRTLQNQVTIVTGGGQGIGKGIAMVLAGEGAKVVLAEKNPDTGAELLIDAGLTARLFGEDNA